jgi:hypothetical protein
MKLPRASLRDLFWLVLVAACLCGWGAETWQMRMQLLRQMQEMEQLRSVHEADVLTAQRAFQQAQQVVNGGRRPQPGVVPGE